MFAGFLVMLATGAIVLTIVYGPDIREVSDCLTTVLKPVMYCSFRLQKMEML